MMRETLLAILVGAGLLLSSCGGGSGGIPSCSAFTACGGDLTGQWTIDGLCTEGDITEGMLDETEMPAECKDAFQNMSLQMSGTLTYANGIETADMKMAMKVKYTFTSACFSAMSMPMTQEACSAAEMTSDDPDAPVLSCSVSGSACNCTMSMENQGVETDTYTVSGSTLTYSDGESAQFCVAGDKLTIREPSEAGKATQVMAHRK